MLMAQMKKVVLYSIFSIALCGNCRAAIGGGGTASIDNDAIIKNNRKWISSHPRLYYTPERLKDLKNRIAADSRMKEAWEELLAKADKLLGDKLV